MILHRFRKLKNSACACKPFCRSKFGFIGASVRRHAERAYHALANLFVVLNLALSEQAGAGTRGARAYHALAKLLRVLSLVWSEQAGAGTRGVPTMRLQTFLSF
jgi:hypothetical protein